MNAVRKIDRSRSGRQVFDITCRGETIYTVREQIQIALEQIHELSVIRHISLPLQNLTQPGELFFFGPGIDLLTIGSLFIFPVRGNTIFCRLMHFIGADLDLERLTGRTDQCRMQRLVHIRLWHGDIILKSARDRFVHFVDHTKCRITVLDRIHDNTDSKKIVDLIERFALIFHLLIDGIKVFRSAEYFPFYTVFFHKRFDLLHDVRHELTAFGKFFVDMNEQIMIRFGIDIFQAKIFEFALHVRNTETPRKRRINF